MLSKTFSKYEIRSHGIFIFASPPRGDVGKFDEIWMYQKIALGRSRQKRKFAEEDTTHAWYDFWSFFIGSDINRNEQFRIGSSCIWSFGIKELTFCYLPQFPERAPTAKSWPPACFWWDFSISDLYSFRRTSRWSCISGLEYLLWIQRFNRDSFNKCNVSNKQDKHAPDALWPSGGKQP